ncbi:hypothetical protein HDU98_011806 [Podochytrium sp. JEL0797]|nr:hypothetical protein HDU98_011806 [Podochytrium sp. JEL0797]
MGDDKKKKKKGGKEKKGKKKDHGGKKDHGEKMILNARGEMVPVMQFAMEQTLDATTKSLVSYKERMTGLIVTNEVLQENCTQQEKDALDVIAALHAESDKKGSQIKELRDEMEAAMERAKLERQAIIEEAEMKIQEMNAILNEKDSAFKVMQAEFAVIKDFRKKRQDMLKDLEYQKEELADTQRQHKDTVTRMERKFFEEKIRLQKEANRKISELASKAHKEAVANLDDTTKEIYKKNLQMAESLRYHVEEGEELGKQNRALLLANRQLMEEKDLHNVIVKEKVLQVKQQSQEIKDLNSKIESMEHSLSHVVREFEHEREIIGKLARKEINEVKKVATRLRENLEVKSYEMKHIKRLAQHVLDQRTKLEKFFMDALDHVRTQIVKEREMAKKAAHNTYNRRIREVMSKKSVPFPPVQSFRPNATPLTNQFKLSAATAVANSIMKPPPSPPTQTAFAAEDAKPPPIPGPAQVDIKDLSWPDKERVLRLLFAKMNGVALGVEDDLQPSEEPEDSQQGREEEEYYYDDSMYHDGNGGQNSEGGDGEIPEGYTNVVDVALLQQVGEQQPQQRTQDVPSQPQQFDSNSILKETAATVAPQTETGPTQANDIVVSDIQASPAVTDPPPALESKPVINIEPGNLTTAYSGSRRNLIPKSEHALEPIISGVTPTDVSRAESVTSNH